MFVSTIATLFSEELKLFVRAASCAACGARGLKVNAAGVDDDAVGRDEQDGVARDRGGGWQHVRVFMLEVDFSDGAGVDAEL